MLAAVGWAASSLGAEPAPLAFRLPKIFGNHMVLPAGDTAVWGWAPAGREVTVTVGDRSATARADREGRFRVVLERLEADGQPTTLTVACAEEKPIEFSDVLVGDVWLGAGQSNMGTPVRESLQAQATIAAADCPRIRLFRLETPFLEQPADDVVGFRHSGWSVCTPERVADFSATLYYFGREVHDREKIPVGLVMCSVGGMPIEPFVPLAGFEVTSELADVYQSIRKRSFRRGDFAGAAFHKIDLIEEWIGAARTAVAERKDPPHFPAITSMGEPNIRRSSTMLFNGAIAPLSNFNFRGVVWYQGEGNEHEQESYTFKMRALVDGWRRCFRRPDLPFYYVQLANFADPDDKPEGYHKYGYARIRMGQSAALADLEHTGMVVTVDITDGNLHPPNKNEIGRRLALWALRNEYGRKEVVAAGPLYRSMRVDGPTIRVAFDHADDGLMVGEKNDLEPVREVAGGKLAKFAIAGADRVWHWADARIDGPEVVVSSAAVPEPVAVRYGFTMNPRGLNLYNKAGLPASPFRTDRWLVPWE